MCIVIWLQKKNDTIHKHMDEAVMSAFAQHKIKEMDDCRVQQIIHTPCCDAKDTLVFSYNSWGDPSYIKRLPLAGTGAPNYIFKYDRKKRLTDIIGMYEHGAGAEFWHKYFYENPGNSNIIKDSTFYFVDVNNDMIVSYMASSVTYFTYDNWDRIIKDSTTHVLHGISQVNNYVYDANGNRTGRTYDNKINIHRTNKIWMFYDRDYSVNNPFPAANYNASGLPAEFDFRSSGNPNFMNFVTYFKDAKITYNCSKERPSF
jgi:hypothetical protein